MSKKKNRHNFILLVYFIRTLTFTALVIIGYNSIVYGFSGEGYGLGVPLATIFPMIWFMIYFFARKIEDKNTEIHKLKKGKIEQNSSEVDQNVKEVEN